ncbi:MAG: flagellar biosynthetic protein FliO [bacterium]
MKRTVCSLLLLSAFLFPSIAHALVKLKDVSQSGMGNTGTIRIEMNGSYERSKVKITYESDHLSLIMGDAFIIPIKKIFKSSSAKSSILKMEASMVPSAKRSGGTVKLNIYFRVPIDTIKKTGSLSGKGNILTFSYKTLSDTKEVVPAVAPAVVETKTPTAEVKGPAPSIPEAGLQDNGDNAIKKDTVAEAKTKEIEEKIGEAQIKTDRNIWTRVLSLRGLIFKLVKIGAVLVGVIVLLFLALFFFKKRSEQSSNVSSSKQPASVSRPTTSPDMIDLLRTNTAFGNSIKVLSSFSLEDDKRLHIIEIMGERMLIGTSKTSISMITKLGNFEKAEEVNHDHEAVMRSRLKDKLRNL